MSALTTSETRGCDAVMASTHCLSTAITSSHSPSMLVNIALVSCGRPEARTMRTDSATAAAYDPVSSGPAGAMLKATIMWSRVENTPRGAKAGRRVLYCRRGEGQLSPPSLPEEPAVTSDSR